MQTQKQVLQIEGIGSNTLLNEVERILNKALSSIVPKQSETELISRQNVADIFNVSLPTIHAWTNAGILKAYKIGHHTRFKKSEVLQACKPIKEKI